MIRAALPLLACLAGCGRLEFGEVRDAVQPIGHDEDGDGLGDANDPCPHVAGTAEDSDGDGVGDACDPHPMTPGDHIGLFTPLTPGTSPFATNAQDFIPEVDSVRYTRTPGGTEVIRRVSSARIEIGFDILEILSSSTQHQIGIGVPGSTMPYYFVELNDNDPTHDIGVISYDTATGYTMLAMMVIPPFHTGPGIARLDVSAATKTHAAVMGWDNELYNVMAATPAYAGGDRVNFAINGIDLRINYFIIIDTP